MPTPQGLNTTTLHGKFVQTDTLGTPLQGTLSFTPNPPTLIFPVQNIIVEGTQSVTLDSNGEFMIDLISTDQAGENPSGWVYSVVEKINGQQQRTYLMSLNFTNGVTVELAGIVPTQAAPNYIPVIGPTGAPGLVTSVNGHSTAIINLVAADLPDLIPLAQKAAANGVATLDASSKIPSAQLPDISGTYIATTRINAASGVAGLDASSKVLPAQLNLASSAPPSVATTAAVGTSTNLARQDHVHAGVDLTSAQTVAGVKNFSSGTQLTQVGVGVAAGTQRVHIVSTVDETVVQADQVTITGTKSIFGAVGFDNTMNAYTAQVTGDTVPRVSIKTSGNIEFGPGNAARDTTLYRSAAGNLNSNQFNADASAPTAASHLTRKDYVDGNFSSLAGTQTISGIKTFSAAVNLNGGGALAGTWTGSPTFSGGVNFTTLSAFFSRTTTNGIAWRTQVSADTQNRLETWADGTVNWGSGSAALDTNLYRGGANLLKTDDSLTIGIDLTVTGNINSAANLSMSAEVAYTPVMSGAGFALGNGTISGSYVRVGKKITCWGEVVFGTTTTVGTGIYSITAPFTAATGPAGASANWAYGGSVRGHGSKWYAGTAAVLGGTNTIRLYEDSASTEYSGSIPQVWTASSATYFHWMVEFMIP